MEFTNKVLCMLVLLSPMMASDVLFHSPKSGILKDRLENNYLVLLKHKAREHHDATFKKIEGFVASLAATGSGHTACEDNFSIGDLAAMRISGHKSNIDKLVENEDVDFVEPLMEWKALGVEEDKVIPRACLQEDTAKMLWGLSRISVRDKPRYSSAKYTYRYNDGEGVYVYVVDTGVYTEHVEFQGRVSWGYTAAGVRPIQGNVDNNGHGTHVSGTIAGKTYGVAKNASIIAVKVLDQNGVGTTADVLEGLNWVYRDVVKKKTSRGAEKVKAVINMSLGGFANSVSQIIEAALLQLIDAGVSVSVAAGNDATDACVQSPARLGAAITVGAMDVRDQLTLFSNYGPCVDVLAPGDDILSAYIGDAEATARYRGTSMSAPHVAGIVARFMSQNENNPSPSQVKGWLLQTSTPGVIDISNKIATPNRMLYMPCEAVRDSCVLDLSNYGYDGEVTKRDNIIFWMSVGMGALGLITIVSIAFACFSKSSSKKSTGSRNGEHQRILGYDNQGVRYT